MATALAIAAIIISILSAAFAAYVSYQVNGGGFRVSEDLLSDLAALLAAVRSIAIKGAIVMGEQRTLPIPIDVEVAAVGTFVASPSGLALMLYAGAVGSAGASDDPRAGRWRVLQFHLTNLGSQVIATTSDNQVAGKLALEIELTLSQLDRRAIQRMRRRMRNLPAVLSSLTASRRQNILLNALDQVRGGREDSPNESGVTGVEDPDLDTLLASLAEATKEALDPGTGADFARADLIFREILTRYERKVTGTPQGSHASPELPPSDPAPRDRERP